MFPFISYLKKNLKKNTKESFDIKKYTNFLFYSFNYEIYQPFLPFFFFFYRYCMHKQREQIRCQIKRSNEQRNKCSQGEKKKLRGHKVTYIVPNFHINEKILYVTIIKILVTRNSLPFAKRICC